MFNWKEMLLTLLIFSPFLGILLVAFVPRDRAGFFKWMGVIISLIPLALSLYLYTQFDYTNGKTQFVEQSTWVNFFPNQGEKEGVPLDYVLDYHVGIDGLSLAMIMLTSIIGTMVAFASLNSTKRWKEYYILYFVNLTGMLGVFASQNLFLFFIFFEVSLIATFLLLLIWGYVNKERTAMKFLIYNGVGSAIMLLVFIILFVNMRTLDIGMLTQQIADFFRDYKQVTAAGVAQGAEMEMYLEQFNAMHTLLYSLGIALFVAFAIKIPIFPLHTWMVRIYTDAHPAVVMVHSAILLKIGAYGVIRLNMGIFPEVMNSIIVLVAILGVVNILYGAIAALVQQDLRLILAYSSLSHMGIILLGLGALNFIGLNGAVFQMVSHGFISAILIFIVGLILIRTNTTKLEDIGGLAKSMPYMCGILLTAAMASVGLPGMSGFISEFLAFLGLFKSMPWIAAVGTLGIIITAVYILRFVLHTTFGKMDDRWKDLKDARPLEAIPMVVLTGLIILIGVYPTVLGQPLHATLEQFVLRIGG